MQFALSAIVAAALALAASAAPTKMIEVTKYSGTKVPNSFIVRVKDGVKVADFVAANPTIRGSLSHANLANINGFAGTFDSATLNTLRANDQVASISEDGLVHTQTTQTNAPWGIARLSHNDPLPGSMTSLNYTYTYSDTYQGQGVDIYIVDTGINLSHNDFGGRATFGWTGEGLAQLDDHGHGSHVSGIAAGTRYGVAKQANLISVKVLDNFGSGTLADVIGGFNFVQTAAAASGRPSVASASLGGGASDAIDDSVISLIASGVTVVVAAGNSDWDAVEFSPARVAAAITVGAITKTDAKASFSNYGDLVDIWAPGVSITSAGYTTNTSTIVYSGTSQATPHVTGLVALYLSEHGATDPAVVAAEIGSLAGKITGLSDVDHNRLAVGPVVI